MSFLTKPYHHFQLRHFQPNSYFSNTNSSFSSAVKLRDSIKAVKIATSKLNRDVDRLNADDEGLLSSRKKALLEKKNTIRTTFIVQNMYARTNAVLSLYKQQSNGSFTLKHEIPRIQLEAAKENFKGLDFAISKLKGKLEKRADDPCLKMIQELRKDHDYLCAKACAETTASIIANPFARPAHDGVAPDRQLDRRDLRRVQQSGMQPDRQPQRDDSRRRPIVQPLPLIPRPELRPELRPIVQPAPQPAPHAPRGAEVPERRSVFSPQDRSAQYLRQAERVERETRGQPRLNAIARNYLQICNIESMITRQLIELEELINSNGYENPALLLRQQELANFRVGHATVQNGIQACDFTHQNLKVGRSRRDFINDVAASQSRLNRLREALAIRPVTENTQRLTRVLNRLNQHLIRLREGAAVLPQRETVLAQKRVEDLTYEEAVREILRIEEGEKRGSAMHQESSRSTQADSARKQLILARFPRLALARPRY